MPSRSQVGRTAAFDVAVEQVVEALLGSHPDVAPLIADVAGLDDPFRRGGRHAGVEDLAVSYELVERAE